MARVPHCTYLALVAISMLLKAGLGQLPIVSRVALTSGVPECLKNPNDMTHDGTCNNGAKKFQGAAKQPFKVLVEASKRNPTSINLPSARLVSNIISSESKTTLNARRMREFWVFFGQLVDHTFAETHLGNDSMNIPIPANDRFFPPGGELPFKRTIKLPTPRGVAPENVLSSYLDASAIYGVEEDLVDRLKLKRGGKLKMSAGNLLPLITDKGRLQFISGDARVNENPALQAMHTLFAREHNRVADELKKHLPVYASDGEIFDLARRVVAAEQQAIIYDEFIPAILGRKLPPYRGYDKWTDATLSNEFATVIFRVGHTLVNPEFTLFSRLGRKFTKQLRDTFFRIEVIREHGIESVFHGILNSRAAEVDVKVSDAIRNFLTLNTPMRVDLVSLNIQRARDHAVPSYNQLRRGYGLKAHKFFWEITKDADLARRLHSVYGGDIEKIDAWIGGLAEDHVAPGSLGELYTTAWVREFTGLRSGNRFHFENPGFFPADVRAKLPTVVQLFKENGNGGTMRRILLANTKLTEAQVPRNPFIDSNYL